MAAQIADFVELSRPKHWAKNAFVLMPIPFALADGAELRAVPFLLGLLGFSLANSAVSAFNDARAKADTASNEQMQKMTAGMPLPPGFKLPF